MLFHIKNILFLLCFPVLLSAQSISGKVESLTGEKIPQAQIILKDSASAVQIKEFTLARDGRYQLEIKKKYTSVWIEVSCLGYKKSTYLINQLLPQAYTLDFVLEPAIIQLDEIIIADTKHFERRGDTLSFHVDAYRDGSEQKIEDLIKKLPGIEVNENTGSIKYKGKDIKTVNLDGDNLFDSNYAIGTRNIDVNMVEEVEAIENYNENPLLHGLDGKEDVALNLVLKKTKTEYSGNIQPSLGLFLTEETSPATDLSSTLLGIASKYKSFATLSYNNVGRNNTPYSYAEYSEEIDAQRNPLMFAKKYISDSFFSTSVGPQRSNFNNTLFGSYNAVFKVKKRLKIKLNAFYLNDKISSEQFTQNDYNFNDEIFSTTDEISIQKIPQRYVGKLQMNYNLSKKSMLEYHGSYDFEKINTSNAVLQNNMTAFDNALNTAAYLSKNKFVYTNRISKNAALQITGHYVTHQTPQNYFFSPAVYQSDMFDTNIQSTEFRKEYFDVNASLMGSKGKNNASNEQKYEVYLGGIAYNSFFNANLLGFNTQESTNLDEFENDQQYQYRSLYAGGNYKFERRRWKVKTSFKASYLEQVLEDYTQARQLAKHRLLLEPSALLSYKIGRWSSLSLNASYLPRPFSEEYFISNPVLLSPRNISLNEASLDISENISLNGGYSLNDMVGGLRMSFMGMYSLRVGNYFSRFVIQPNSTRTVRFFLPESNTMKGLNVMIEKYIDPIESTIRIQSNYNFMTYFNSIGNETLRENSNHMLNQELFFKTAFDIKVNFENILNYSWSVSKTENGERFANQSLMNTFKIIVKPSEKLLVFVNYDYFLPSLQGQNPSISFLDIEARYKVRKTSWSISLKNLGNVRTFDQVSVNDFSSYVYQINLLPRHFLVNYFISF